MQYCFMKQFTYYLQRDTINCGPTHLRIEGYGKHSGYCD